MTHQEILEKLKTKAAIIESKEDLGVLNAYIAAADVRSAALFMRDGLKFAQLNFVTAVDMMANNTIEVVYSFTSYETGDRAVIKVKLDRTKPEIDTICDIYRTADWHERETFEMFGVVFANHPDLRKLITPESVTNPLRKDFTHPGMEKLPTS